MFLKNIFKNFTLKEHYREKKSKCLIVGQVDKFYKNILLQQKDKLETILSDGKNHNLEFLLRAYSINDYIYKDDNLHDLLTERIYEAEYKADTSKNKNTMYNLYRLLAERYENDPTSSVARELVITIIKKSYLFSKDELSALLKMFKLTENEAKEIEDNLVTTDNKYLNSLAFNDRDNLAIKFSKNKNKVTIYSKKLNKKIVLCALSEHTDNVLKAFEIVDKEKPNVLVFQKRPIFGLDNCDEYVSVFDKERLMAYYREVLSDGKLYQVNNVEKLVYQNVNNIRTINYVQSLMLKCYYSLNINYDLKVIFSDLPKSYELKNVMTDILPDNNTASYFFNTFKLDYLFEKYIWFVDDINKRCFGCSSQRNEDPHLSTEGIIESYTLVSKNNSKVRNISEKIVNAAKVFKDEPVILAFVEKDYLYSVVEQIAGDLINLDMASFKGENYIELFDHKKMDLYNLYTASDKKEFLNKLAIANNIYSSVR
jgi:hypothetical protein